MSHPYIHSGISPSSTFTHSLHISVKLAKDVFLAPTLTTCGGFITSLVLRFSTLGFFWRMISNTLSNSLGRSHREWRRGRKTKTRKEREKGKVCMWFKQLLSKYSRTKPKKNRPLHTCSPCPSRPRVRNPTPNLRLALPPQIHLLWHKNSPVLQVVTATRVPLCPA